MSEKRQRLTITLRKDLIKSLDGIIDGARIRNRSHAIEYLLNQALAPRIKKAIILAGGEGLKMRPFTYEMPKAMIPVKGRPILEHTVELLREYDIRNLVISVGYLGEKIKEYFGTGGYFGVKITYSEQPRKKIGTAGALALVKDLIDGEPFILFYGDVLAEIDLKDLIDFHRSHKGLATMALTSVADPSLWGVVKLHGTKILDFAEKPKKSLSLSRLINAGIYVLEPEVLDRIPPKKSSRLEVDVFPQLAREGKLSGYPFEGQWFDIGTPEIYERVIKEWKGRGK